MKQEFAARDLGDGVVEPRHVVEVLCAVCEDPVSEQEAETGVCTACGSPWQSKQHVQIWATSVPWASGGVM